MEAIRIEAVAEEDGEVHLTGLPFKKGETVVLTVERGNAPPGGKDEAPPRTRPAGGISEEEFWDRLIVPTTLSKEEFRKVLDVDHWDE